MKKEEFLKAIDTLKLYRRAELLDDEGKQIISELYVDPLPNEHVLKTLIRPNTTFLIGRKGTGKSTIFQKAQDSLKAEQGVTWAYIDIKTLYESSTSELVGDVPGSLKNALSPESIRKLTVFRSFVIELVGEIKNQIDQRTKSSLLSRLKDSVTGTTTELFERLDEFVADLKSDQYLNVTSHIQQATQDEGSRKNSEKIAADVSAKISSDPDVKANIYTELISELEKKQSQNYSQVFIKAFNIRQLIIRLKEILTALDLKHIFIFVDDFSELPKSDMEQLVDAVIAPLNNWSEEFIKLKIAVYPGRVYSGDIDISKVDEIYLDIYRAYGRNDVSNMEERAIDFTKRLVTTRLHHFCSAEAFDYFDSHSDEFWRTLFYACIGNPRILGYILFYAFETTIIYDKKIGIRTIQDAARRYYEEKIDQSFRMNKFLHEAFEERSSIYSLKELLEEVVKREKSLRTYSESKVMREIEGRPPTSHFHVHAEYDAVLSSLELNFFFTKYYEMKDRDGRDVAIYAMNYGLCQQEAITFGRPRGRREHRLYFVERIFDFTPIIISYIKVNQEIVCDSCGARHGHEKLGAIQAFDMLCPDCRQGVCRVVNLSRKYENLVKSISEDSLLPSAELGILKTLHDGRKEMFAKEIAAELDCSYQLIGRRGKHLSERGLVDRDQNDSGRRVFQLSDKGEKIYFVETDDDRMDFDEDSE